MKFVIKNTSRENLATLMRRIGYHFIGTDKGGSQLSFVRSWSSFAYPRFHIYLKENKEMGETFLSLHLDQKKPSYKGAPAHSADYEGEVLEKEAERIQTSLQKQTN